MVLVKCQMCSTLTLKLADPSKPYNQSISMNILTFHERGANKNFDALLKEYIPKRKSLKELLA